MLRFMFIAVLVALTAPTNAHAQKIVIDPGHGGTDPGGVGTGMQEKNVVLDISKRFDALLDADTADTAGGGKWTSLMTRTTDVYVSLAGRSAYSNNNDADRFMCIHANAFSDPAANGTETFSYATTGLGAQLRNLVQAEMITAWGLTNRGNKTANFAVLRDTAAPAELHELAFITNATDAVKLASLTERQKAAEAHLRAIQRHYSITPYIPGAPTPQDPDGDITGHVDDDLGPVSGATVKLDDGTSVVTDSDGAFAFTHVPVGTRMVTASASGHSAKTVEVNLVAATPQDIDITLVRANTGSGSGSGEDPDLGTGGCSTGGGEGLAGLMLVGFVLVGARRRRA